MPIHKIRCAPGRLAALVLSALFALNAFDATRAHANGTRPRALWVADGTFAEFAYKSLRRTGTTEPGTRLEADGKVAQWIRFDSTGNLWGLLNEFDPDDVNLIFEMTPRDIKEYKSTHVMSPTVSISNSCSNPLFQPFELDPAGNVWLVCSDTISGSQQIIEYTKSQFGPSVSPEPAVSIKPLGLTSIGSIRFDRSGNLWMLGGIADQTGSFILKLTRDQLTTSGTPTPALIITEPDPGDGYFPAAMAFDHHGNLWVLMDSHPVPTITLTEQVESFSAKSISGTGTIALHPAITLDLSPEDIFPFSDLAFDRAGNLWLGGSFGPGASEILKLTARQLMKSGSVRSSVSLIPDDKDTLDLVRSLTFGPGY